MRERPGSKFSVDGVRLADARAWFLEFGMRVGMIVEEEVFSNQDFVKPLGHWWTCFLTRQISVPGMSCNQGASGQGEGLSDTAVWMIVGIKEEQGVL